MKFYQQPIYYFYTICVLLTSCNTYKYRYIAPDPAVKSRSLQVGFLRPNCVIGIIEEGNKATYDSVASKEAQQKVSDAFKEILSQHASAKEVITDTATYKTVYREIIELDRNIKAEKDRQRRRQIVESYSFSKQLDSLIQANQIDQLIICSQSGFYRTKANFRKENWKGAGIGLLTLGTYIPAPLKSATILSVWVVDRSKKTLVFSNLNGGQIHPTNGSNLKQLVCQLFQKFYTSRHENGSCILL